MMLCTVAQVIGVRTSCTRLPTSHATAGVGVGASAGAAAGASGSVAVAVDMGPGLAHTVGTDPVQVYIHVYLIIYATTGE